MSYIVVTGGAGFIGSHLCEALIGQGRKVINIDNFNDYYDPQIKRDNVMETIKFIMSNGYDDDCYKVEEGDIRDDKFLDRVFGENEIEAVVQLAAFVGVRPSIENSTECAEININGTLNVLENMKKYAIKRFILASSSSVYGNNPKVPFSEEDNVDFPISPYAATKKTCELISYTYHSLYNINTACLRFFNAYGPRQRPDQAVHKFTRLILEGREIPLYGDGNSQRDYTYIDDIIDGIIKAINWTGDFGIKGIDLKGSESDLGGSKTKYSASRTEGVGVNGSESKYDIFNLGEANIISLDYMVKEIEEALVQKANIKRLPMQEGDVLVTFADISKARRVLGYEPRTGFSDGVKKFVKWYRERSVKIANARLHSNKQI